MKKAILHLATSASFALLALFPKVAFAAESVCPAGDFSNLCKMKPDKAGGMIGGIVTILFIVAIIITLFFLIIGGIKWTASGGDKAKVEAARNTIVAAIVGLVVTLLAFFIINFILSMFTGSGISGLKIPTLY